MIHQFHLMVAGSQKDEEFKYLLHKNLNMKKMFNSFNLYASNNNKNHDFFIIEPLEIGQGLTLGNSIRRTLLNDLVTFNITGVRINNLKHEFASIDGVREDTLEVLLNLKQIVLKSKFNFNQQSNNLLLKYKGFVNIKGPIILTAGMFNIPKNIFKIINPEQYICTIVTNSSLYIEFDIQNGISYQLDKNKDIELETSLNTINAKTLLIDTNFIPIKRVNYKIQLIHDSYGLIKESLNLEILTNGSITPKRSLKEALKLLINLFSSTLININLLKFFTHLNIN